GPATPRAPGHSVSRSRGRCCSGRIKSLNDRGLRQKCAVERARFACCRWGGREPVRSGWCREGIFQWGTAGAVPGIHIAMLLGPIWGISVAVAHFVLYVFVLAPTFNALRHWSRRKNFLTNNATNLRVLAWLTSGERLRNNHHAYPSSPKFSTGRFEFD